MKPGKRRLEVNLEELDRVPDGARQAPLSEADHDKLKDATRRSASKKLIIRTIGVQMSVDFFSNNQCGPFACELLR
jgi:hypothetical protein